MSTIRIKRRIAGNPGAPATLVNAELAFNEVDYTLYYGSGDSGGNATNIYPIAGPGAFVTLTSTQTIAGVKTFSSGLYSGQNIPLASEDTTVATTKWVTDKIGSISAGVTTFNGRSGAVTLESTDVTGALGYTPANNALLATVAFTGSYTDLKNTPAPFVLAPATTTSLGGIIVGDNLTIDVNGRLSATANPNTVLSFNGRTGAVTLQAGDVTPITDPLYLSLNGGTVNGSLTIAANLTVNGTTTTINSQTLDVADKNITLANSTTPSDAAANGGGITILGTTNKTFEWYQAPNAWVSSENLSLNPNKYYAINGIVVLSSTELGSTVVNSSLEAVGVISVGTWQADVVAVPYGGTGVSTLTGMVKGNGQSPFTAAVPGVDYLSPNSVIDGGSF